MSAPGFGPIGATPVAALPDASAAGTNYVPGTATITFQGFAPTAAYPFSPSRVYANFAETLHGGGATNIRTYANFAETLHSGGATNIRTYGVFAEVLVSISAAAGGGGFVSILW